MKVLFAFSMLIVAFIIIGAILEIKRDGALKIKCSKEIQAKNLSDECIGYLIDKGQSRLFLPIPLIIQR